ncbi:type I-F CRISPR-associated protein Csy3 [Pseudomonas sp. F1_0610]|uniref:type I-F CRISPR-associated protein Csy3 n=1 Tax=Pseudomonas sp. F1_0610 TaxID=3114284 RepID=UPI0039C2E323
MAKSTIEVASVLSFEKKLVPSDAFFYGTTWSNRSQAEPLALVEKSVRGTISNRLKAATANNTLKLNAEVDKANLQRVDTCALTEKQDTLKVTFTLKVLSGLDKPSACNNKEFLASYAEAVQTYIAEFGFKELAKRYAYNIANGRFLWRNRVGAEKIQISVTLNDGVSLEFNAFEYSLKEFDKTDTKLEQLAAAIAEALEGKQNYLLIKVEAYALLGQAQEVYPSEELVLDKNNSKDKKSKILYAVNDVAAMHSQKIGNALRTIDTWYPDFAEYQLPIAAEPYGAVTNLGHAFRTPKEKNDFFSLFDAFSTGDELSSLEQKHYVIAVLIRGGVFGKSTKE